MNDNVDKNKSHMKHIFYGDLRLHILCQNDCFYFHQSIRELTRGTQKIFHILL